MRIQHEYVNAAELREKHRAEIKSIQKEIDLLTERHIRGTMDYLDYFVKREQLVVKMVELKIMIKEREYNEQFLQKPNGNAKGR